MENKAIIFTILLFFFSFDSNELRNEEVYLPKQYDPTKEIPSLETLPHQKVVDIFHAMLKVYNPDTQIETPQTIALAIKEYGLDKSSQMIQWSVYQILLESSGFHTKGDTLTTSYAGALGLTQITIPTVFQYWKVEMSDNDRERFIELGGTNLKLTPRDKLNKKRKLPLRTQKKIKTWLKNEANAILLWGYIMGKNTEKHGFYDALVIYNTGYGGYLRLKNPIEEHKYIQGIQRVEKFMAKKRQP